MGASLCSKLVTFAIRSPFRSFTNNFETAGATPESANIPKTILAARRQACWTLAFSVLN
jgi:hypothetical protein